jgi:hypothetical protein
VEQRRELGYPMIKDDAARQRWLEAAAAKDGGGKKKSKKGAPAEAAT